jgi:hypothetical protein
LGTEGADVYYLTRIVPNHSAFRKRNRRTNWRKRCSTAQFNRSGDLLTSCRFHQEVEKGGEIAPTYGERNFWTNRFRSSKAVNRAVLSDRNLWAETPKG